jgi:hypothetical protein
MGTPYICLGYFCFSLKKYAFISHVRKLNKMQLSFLSIIQLIYVHTGRINMGLESRTNPLYN